jgi:hypothetical protein
LTASGGLFSMFAFAALLRILMVATQLSQDADLQPLLAWLPAACWSATALAPRDRCLKPAPAPASRCGSVA